MQKNYKWHACENLAYEIDDVVNGKLQAVTISVSPKKLVFERWWPKCKKKKDTELLKFGID